MKNFPLLKKFDSILNHRPLMVGTLTGRVDLTKQIKVAHRADVDIIEVRLDTYPLNAARPLVKIIRRLSKKPLLLTFRSPREGGDTGFKNWLSAKDHLEFLKGILPLGDLIDLEIQSKPLTQTLTKLARAKGVLVVHSFHDFKRLPANKVLSGLARRSLNLKGDFFKVAVMVPTDAQLPEFLTWGAACAHPKPVLIAMGENGKVSRVLGFCFGSTMTFGHLGSAAAPGQMGVKELAKIVRNIFKPLHPKA